MLYPSHPADVRTRAQLRTIPIPKRDDVSDRWRGMQHGELADLVVRQARRLGLEVANEEWQVNGDGADLFGSLDFTRESSTARGITLPRGLGLSLGMRSSNKGRYSHTFALGARVSVCQNGMIVGEYTFRRRHTINAGVDMPELIYGGLQTFLGDANQGITERVHTLQDVRVKPMLRDRILLESARRGLVSWGRVGRVDKEFAEPRHEEFQPRNGWSLYNAYTEVAKDFSARQQMEVQKGVGDLILEVAGVN